MKYKDGYVINCNYDDVKLSQKELFYLKSYKSSSDDYDYFKTFGFDLSLRDMHLLSDSLSYSNINSFCRFICNPSNEDINNIYFHKLKNIIEAIKTIIDVSCRYALANGINYNVLFRSENINNLKSYNGIDYITCPKSASRDPRVGLFMFANDDTFPISFKMDKICPYFNMEKIPLGLIDGESETLIPPFLKIGNVTAEDVKTDYSVVCTKNVEVKCEYKREEDFLSVEDLIKSSSKNSLPDYAIEEVEEYFATNKELNDDILALLKRIYDYLENYAKNTYNKFYIEFKKKYLPKFILLWSEKEKGLEQAIRKVMCLGVNPPSSAMSYEGLSLKYLIRDGYIPFSIVKESFDKNDPKIIENYFKQENGVFKPLTKEEYDELLRLFYVAAGFEGEDNDLQNNCIAQIMNLNFLGKKDELVKQNNQF